MKLEVLHCGDAASEVIAPSVESLRVIGNAGSRGFATLQWENDVGIAVGVLDSLRRSIHQETQAVVNRLVGGQMEGERYVMGLVVGIGKFIHSGKFHSVGAVPEQSFLTIADVQVGVDTASE